MCRDLTMGVLFGNPNLAAAEREMSQIWTLRIPMTTGAF